MAAGLPKTKMTRWQLTMSLFVLFLAVATNPLLAAGTTASATAEVKWTIVPFQSLTIAGGNAAGAIVSSRFDLRQPMPADFALGYIEEKGALTLVAASNIPWTVKVHALESNMGVSEDGSYVKPLSDFALRVNGGGYFSVTPFDQVLASGDVGSHPLIIDYKVKTERESNKNGDYGLTLVYTITSD